MTLPLPFSRPLATLLAVSGPLAFVRKVLRAWGIWVLLGACLWLTWNLFAKADLADLWRRPGDGSLSLALGFTFGIAFARNLCRLAYGRLRRAGCFRDLRLSFRKARALLLRSMVRNWGGAIA